MNLKCEQRIIDQEQQVINDDQIDQKVNYNIFVNQLLIKQPQQINPHSKPLQPILIQQNQQPTRNIKQQQRKTIKQHKCHLIQIEKHLLQRIIKQNNSLKQTIQQLQKLSQKMKITEQIFNHKKQKMKLKYQRLSAELKRSKINQKENQRQISQIRFENDKLRTELAKIDKSRLLNISSMKVSAEQSMLLSSSWQKGQKLKNINNLTINSNIIQFTYQTQLQRLVNQEQQFVVVESIPSDVDWVNSTPCNVKQSQSIKWSIQKDNKSQLQNTINYYYPEQQYQQLVTHLQSQLKQIKHQLLTQHPYSPQPTLPRVLRGISQICMSIIEYVQNYQQLSSQQLQIQQHHISSQTQSLMESNNARFIYQLQSLDVMFNSVKYRLELLKKLQTQKYIHIETLEEQVRELKKEILHKEMLVNKQKQYINSMLNHNLNTLLTTGINKEQTHHHDHHTSPQLSYTINNTNNNISYEMITELQQLLDKRQKHTRELQSKLQHIVGSQMSQPYVSLFQIQQQGIVPDRQRPQQLMIIEQSIYSKNSNHHSEELQFSR